MTTIEKYTQYFPKVEEKIYSSVIDGKNFFDQSVKGNRTYDNI